jgi:2-(1,2-epoxy-1,2-dihydrophenyl)acetyl-CoA isomerase
MGYQTITYEVSGGVATLTLNRPERLNALDLTITEEMKAVLVEAAADLEVRCLLITGAGRAFCTGADLTMLEDTYKAGEVPQLDKYLREGYHHIILPIIRMEKPVVAAVNGFAAGAGASLALACDFRIASEQARFFQAFIKVGLVPDSGATYFLPRMVGLAKAMELGILGDVIDAQEALRLGLVTKVVAPDKLADEARAFAERLAAGPTRAIGLAKKALHFGAVHDLEEAMDYEADLQGQVAHTADHMEGVKAFLSKREAKFEGR